MMWPNGDEPSQDGTDSGYRGLYKWTMDALFGSRVSPSRKYKEFSQDDTNYNGNQRRRRHWKDSDSSVRSMGSERFRSNSLSGLDPTFYNRHELLPEVSDNDVDVYERLRKSPRIESPIELLSSVPPVRGEPTDTFGTRRKPHIRPFDEDFSIVARSPSLDDPIISRLFDRDTKKGVRSAEIPGKFPSPAKISNSVAKIDYTDEYLQILDQLERNDKLLSDMSKTVQAKNELNLRKEESYRIKYRHTRLELIKELKHSKAIYDNYYTLYGKYQQLKTISQDAVQLQSHVSRLETQLVDVAIEKEKQIHSLSRRIFELELRVQETETSKEKEIEKYEIRIAELEGQLALRQPLPSGVSSLSFSPSRSHYRDQSSMSDYNVAVDTQFLKNLH